MSSDPVTPRATRILRPSGPVPNIVSLDDTPDEHTTRTTAFEVARQLTGDECFVVLFIAVPEAFGLSCYVPTGTLVAVARRLLDPDVGLLDYAPEADRHRYTLTPFGRLVVWALLTEFLAERQRLSQLDTQRARITAARSAR